jgi:hypothetical protein
MKGCFEGRPKIFTHINLSTFQSARMLRAMGVGHAAIS